MAKFYASLDYFFPRAAIGLAYPMSESTPAEGSRGVARSLLALTVSSMFVVTSKNKEGKVAFQLQGKARRLRLIGCVNSKHTFLVAGFGNVISAG